MFDKFYKNSIVVIGVMALILGATIPKNVWADEILDEALELEEEVIVVEEEAEIELPEIYIKAVNPGYKIDDISNVGEMIEIGRKESDVPISLAGAAVGYTNSSGNYSIIFEFPENSWMAGENLLLRLAGSPMSELASETYTKTLAFKAGITLFFDNEIVDEVCWDGKEGCYKAFDSAHPTTLVRDIETGEFVHVSDYEPEYVAENYYVVEEENTETAEGDGNNEPEEEGGEEVSNEEENKVDEEEKVDEIKTICPKTISFTEILTYFVESETEQFIELFNNDEVEVELSGCVIKYKNKEYNLEGVVGAKEFYVYHPEGFRLTKNPAKENTIELMDFAGEIIDSLVYYNGQKKGTSYALVEFEDEAEWMITYNFTPGEKNIYQQFRTCEAGKVINELTGNCVKEQVEVIKICPEGYFLNEATGRCKKETVLIEKTCKDGYYLNEDTGRCRKIVEETTKVCKDGYYLNILTGRCRKIVEETEKTCKEGYYLNEETGRCKKIQENTGASYEIEPKEYEEKSSFVALYAVIGVVALGLVYVIYEFRKEIARLFKKIFRR